MTKFNLKLAEILQLTKQEISIFEKLNSPQKIQDFLGTLPFNFEKSGETLMSPRRSLEAKKCHCLEGALISALALWLHGYRPLLMDLKARNPDFDHCIAVFKEKKFWGAISKTNHAVLRFRDPIYKNPRELAMSYFHEYFLDNGLKTLTGYSKPFDLRKLKIIWVTSQKNLWEISRALNQIPHFSFVPKNTKNKLRKADKVEIEAGKIVEWR
ncbi:MAG: hypothetical protein Q7S34_02945 [bacterium]|nr:hypothetical protein [bacterium]